VPPGRRLPAPAEAVPGIEELGEGVVEEGSEGPVSGQAEEAAEPTLARRAPPEGDEGNRADG